MNFNTILYRFGLEPNDFVNRPIEPIHIMRAYISLITMNKNGNTAVAFSTDFTRCNVSSDEAVQCNRLTAAHSDRIID